MKKITLLSTLRQAQGITLCFLLLTFVVNAQAPPNAFNYSAVARNAAGQPIATTTIGIQITILKTSPTGASQYSENHFVNTDAYGLFNLIIGAGAVQSGSMATIDWSNDNYYLKVGMDATGGTNFLTMGTTQLLTVPYALHAATADSLIGGVAGFSGNYNDLTNQPISIGSISPNADTLFLSNGQVFTSFNNDNNPTNEIQQLSVSTTGDTLHLQNGGFVIIPGISAANNSGGGNGIYSTGNGVTDVSGNFYPSIIINGQEWMAQNLKTFLYSDGTGIDNVNNAQNWYQFQDTVVPMVCWYENNSWVYNNNNYGALYTWAVTNPVLNGNHNVCPTGWHVPTEIEFSELLSFLGGNSIAGGKMKNIDTLHWWPPNTDASNQSGFNAFATGHRDYTGLDEFIGEYASWWTSTDSSISFCYAEAGSGCASAVWLDHNSPNASIGFLAKQYGFSIRCIKD